MPLFERPRNDLEKFAGSPTPESEGANKDVSMGDYTNKLNVVSHENPEVGLDERYIELIKLQDSLKELNQTETLKRYDIAIKKRDSVLKSITDTTAQLEKDLNDASSADDAVKGGMIRLELNKGRLPRLEIEASEFLRQNEIQLRPLLARRDLLKNRIDKLKAELDSTYKKDESAKYLN